MKKIYFLFTLLLTFLATAQSPGDITQSFGGYPGLNSTVFAIATQFDGKILLGGNFTAYNGITENYIIRLNTDGTKDTSFTTGTGFNDLVNTITIQADGKILVGGDFTSYNGGGGNRIIRLNTDGSIDTSFTTGTGFTAAVNVIETQTDGKLLVGGGFTTYNGGTESRIIRLNTDGTKDSSFTTGTGFSGTVYGIKIQADGKIFAVGGFTTYNGVTENRIIRLNTDGTKDTSFTIGTGFNSTVNTIALEADEKLLVGGAFTNYNGDAGNRIIRLNTDGTKDSSFTIGTGFNNAVNKIEIQSDGKILAGGTFTTYGGIQNRIVRMNTDGTKDTSFAIGAGFTATVHAIATQVDGKILVGGFFTTYNGGFGNRIIRLNTDGTKDISFTTATGFNNFVSAITTQADGKMLVGGTFISYNGGTEYFIIRLNTDGTKDPSFIIGTGFNNQVFAIATQADGKILVGGNFTSYNGSTENRIIRLNSDGTKDTSFTAGTGFNNTIRAIVIQADGKILVGGIFTTYNGISENRVIRLNADGTKDSSFTTGTGFNSNVFAIVTQTDGRILVGGDFTTYNGSTENRIIRLNTDGTKDTTITTGTGFNSIVYTITIQSDGKILVGGIFAFYNGGAQENRINRLNADGTKDTTFTTGTGFNSSVNTITTQADGKILVGGTFTTYNGFTENRIIRLNTDGTKDTAFNTGTGFNNTVYAITTQPNEKILVGGDFTSYKDDYNSAYLIGLHSDVNLSTASFTNANSFVLYPNPVKDVLNFQSNDFSTIKTIKIYDLQGKLVLVNTKEAINVSQLSNGLYLAKITTEKGEVTKKFIKQ